MKMKGREKYALGFVVVIILLVIGYLIYTENKSKWVLIDAIDVPIVIYDENIKVVAANLAALQFYNSTIDQVINLGPDDLYVVVKKYIENYPSWEKEQMGRRQLARDGRLSSKTAVPMKLKDHPYFKGDWYLTSKPMVIGKKRYYVTRFSRTSQIP